MQTGVYTDGAFADILKNNYRERQWKFNSDRLGTEDTLYLMQPIKLPEGMTSDESLNEFLQKSKARGANQVKIYFGAVPTEFPEAPILAGRLLGIFVPARNGEDIYFPGGSEEVNVMSFYMAKETVIIFKNHYLTQKYLPNTDIMERSDSLYAVFSLASIEEFLLAKEALGAEIIRIYFGAYPNGYPDASLAAKQTVMFIGVGYTGTTIRYGKELLEGEKAVLLPETIY